MTMVNMTFTVRSGYVSTYRRNIVIMIRVNGGRNVPDPPTLVLDGFSCFYQFGFTHFPLITKVLFVYNLFYPSYHMIYRDDVIDILVLV